MTTLFGIKNCDTVKKARQWLEQHQIDYHFHDVRNDGLTREQVQQWLHILGWETLINKRSTTWKSLDNATKEQLNDTHAVELILQAPTLIKRPLLETGSHCSVGFKAADYHSLFLN